MKHFFKTQTFSDFFFSTVANMGDISDFDDVRTCDNPTPSGSSSPKTSFQNAENDDDDDIETPAGKIQH